ncbi:MAG: hypothetical protein MJZ76_05985 [Bacteroidales bacterium]|nr:hypothetical protein [Bacteroidales bacterium]
MKKTILFFSLLGIATLMGACNKDCICRYYNDKESVINTEVYDGDDMSNSECADMDGKKNVATEVDDDFTVADHVSCSAQW